MGQFESINTPSFANNPERCKTPIEKYKSDNQRKKSRKSHRRKHRGIPKVDDNQENYNLMWNLDQRDTKYLKKKYQQLINFEKYDDDKQQQKNEKRKPLQPISNRIDESDGCIKYKDEMNTSNEWDSLRFDMQRNRPLIKVFKSDAEFHNLLNSSSNQKHMHPYDSKLDLNNDKKQFDNLSMNTSLLDTSKEQDSIIIPKVDTKLDTSSIYGMNLSNYEFEITSKIAESNISPTTRKILQIQHSKIKQLQSKIKQLQSENNSFGSKHNYVNRDELMQILAEFSSKQKSLEENDTGTISAFVWLCIKNSSIAHESYIIDKSNSLFHNYLSNDERVVNKKKQSQIDSQTDQNNQSGHIAWLRADTKNKNMQKMKNLESHNDIGKLWVLNNRYLVADLTDCYLDWTYDVPKINYECSQLHTSDEEGSFLNTNLLFNKHL